MRKVILSLIVFCVACQVKASGGNETQGARAMSLGGASLTLVDAWGATNNIATIGLLDRHSISAAYETRFFLPEAGMRSLSASAMLGGGSLGLIAHNYGFAGYGENRIGLGYARKLSDYISIGAQVNYVQIRIGDVYGSRAAAVGEIGMLIMPTEKIRIGAHVFNPTRTKLANYNDERLPTSLRLGGQYLFSEKVNASVELDKDINLPLNIKTGIEYRPADPLYIRAGYATAQTTFAMGIGFIWKTFTADVGANWNQNLGYSSAVSLGIQFDERKKKE